VSSGLTFAVSLNICSSKVRNRCGVTVCHADSGTSAPTAHSPQRRCAALCAETIDEDRQQRYSDMLTKLRRVLIAAQFRADPQVDPTPEQIHATCLARADAAA
jgi:hypothetical protein